MKSYCKEFFFRGLICGGFGPLVVVVVYLCLHYTVKDFALTGKDVFLAVLSTYLLAFVHAGASVFWMIEHWHTAKSLFFHFFVLYVAYSLCYLANSWIPFEPVVLAIFTGVFAQDSSISFWHQGS